MQNRPTLTVKTRLTTISALLSAILLTPHTAVAQDETPAITGSNVTCDESLCRQATTRVPLKVLPRPNSSIWAERSTDGEAVVPVVPALSPLFVFAREGVDETDSDGSEGWYEVGPTETLRLGWMQASDVIEWHNTLILSYTPPGVDDEARNRVIGFRGFDDLQAVISSGDRETAAAELLGKVAGLDDETAGAASAVREAGVVSAEPGGVFTDIKDNFYMWPILSWAKADDGESDERLVEFVQLMPECRADAVPTGDAAEGDGATTVAGDAAGVDDSPLVLPGSGDSSGLSNRSVKNIEVMFVVDTTGSMQPYIDAVRDGIRDTVEAISQKAGEDETVRFGFVGFMDEFDELDYVAKDFFEDGFVDAETFVAAIDGNVKAETWGDHLVPERLFEGVDMGIDADWSDEALKFMVVITDAPGIPQSSGGQSTDAAPDENFVRLERSDPETYDRLVQVSVGDAERLGKRARDANVLMSTMHIQSGRSAAIDALAGQQLEAMVQNEGTDEGYIPVAGGAGSGNAMAQAIRQFSTEVLSALGASSVEDTERVAEEIVVSDGSADTGPAGVKETTAQLVKAAMMDFLGDTDTVECDYRGWTSDRDLADDAVKSLDVNTLLVRDELDTLYTTLTLVRDALAVGEMTGEDFIDSLKTVSLSTTLDPSTIETARTGALARTGLLPRWLDSLPYQSDIAQLSGDDIAEMTSSDRTQLEINVSDKLAYYETIVSNDKRWFPLSDSDLDNPLKWVTPLPIEELP